MALALQDEQRELDAALSTDVSRRRQLAHEQVRLLYERLWQPVLADRKSVV